MWTIKSGPGRIWGGGRPTGYTPWLRVCIGRNNKQHTYFIDNRKLNAVRKHDLGVYFAKDMKPSSYCQEACSKASKILGMTGSNNNMQKSWHLGSTIRHRRKFVFGTENDYIRKGGHHFGHWPTF